MLAVILCDNGRLLMKVFLLEVQDYWRFDDEYSSEEAECQDEILGALKKALPEEEFIALQCDDTS